MDKYQVYHYYQHYSPDHYDLYWSYFGLGLIFLVSISIPLYLQHTATGDMPTGEAIGAENYVQWHLEQEIAQIKVKTRARKGKKKRKRGSISTKED
ncbi:hypothetical protein L3Y34_016285 [Caenorhabditis briggsae]|uniref:Uncharacterized protein n=1 Tax=Caenorhabditis briggsae TaxID=6238 RepID=A0AAE9J0A6_CAEBR|nr:hypothetical protein L3Y34_016285 [Caenorhabditis briggsae]